MDYINDETKEIKTLNELMTLVNSSIPAGIRYGVWFPILPKEPPITTFGFKVITTTPEKISDNYYYGWDTVQMTEEELFIHVQKIAEEIVVKVQERLDTFAQTRNYDGILSACTYASSKVSKFASEGQYCVDVRDDTWNTLYSIMTEVQNSLRPMPMSIEDIEGELPVLQWPI